VIDVRTPREWSERHIDGAVNVPLSQLAERIAEVPSDTSLAVYCTGGYRSAIAASVLRRGGRPRVADLVGGLGAWDSSQSTTVGGT
jgi:hydroxyacylglutathione hydrolase